MTAAATARTSATATAPPLDTAAAAPIHLAALALLAHPVAVAGVVQRAAAVGGAGPITGGGFIRALALGRCLAVLRGNA